MLGLIAAVLIVLWLLGFLAFHVSSGLIHVLLVIGIVMLLLHFFRGRSATVLTTGAGEGTLWSCSWASNSSQLERCLEGVGIVAEAMAPLCGSGLASNIVVCLLLHRNAFAPTTTIGARIVRLRVRD